jgi:exodeoxyribonuclease-1
MDETFLFYDIETSGLNKAFDQILDFAAIRTDRGLNETGRCQVRIRLRPDVVPSPGALVVNLIRPAALLAGRCEYEAARAIHAQLNVPGTISIGYNSIGFDDEFLRFTFHRNLLPPYTHQYANGCRRMDLLPITIMAWLYRPELLDWPVENGRSSLKLEEIGALNGLFSGRSHDAMADVEAALRLARILARDRRMWAYLDGCFRREVDARRAEELPVEFTAGTGEHRLALMVAGEFGTRRSFLAPVLSIGSSIPYPKQTLWLRLDTHRIAETPAEKLADAAWVIRKRYGEPGILLPPRPRFFERIDAERQALAQENLAWVKTHAELFGRLVEHHRGFRYAVIPDLDADAGLYQNGFLPRADEPLRDRFHDADPEEKRALAGRFTSPEARTLAQRILWRNFTAEPAGGELPEAAGRVDLAGNPRPGPEWALSEIARLRLDPALAAAQRGLLDELERFIRERAARAADAGRGGAARG